MYQSQWPPFLSYQMFGCWNMLFGYLNVTNNSCCVIAFALFPFTHVISVNVTTLLSALWVSVEASASRQWKSLNNSLFEDVQNLKELLFKIISFDNTSSVDWWASAKNTINQNCLKCKQHRTYVRSVKLPISWQNLGGTV